MIGSIFSLTQAGPKKTEDLLSFFTNELKCGLNAAGPVMSWVFLSIPVYNSVPTARLKGCTNQKIFGAGGSFLPGRKCAFAMMSTFGMHWNAVCISALQLRVMMKVSERISNARRRMSSSSV